MSDLKPCPNCPDDSRLLQLAAGCYDLETALRESDKGVDKASSALAKVTKIYNTLTPEDIARLKEISL